MERTLYLDLDSSAANNESSTQAGLIELVATKQ
jgi:hypothetical protein